MDLDENEVGYFITQVGLAAASFGVTTEDATAVGTTLGKIFGVRCSPATPVVPSLGPQLQSICVADTCPLSPGDTCAAYQPTFKPAVANSTLVGNTTTSSNASGTASTTASPTGSSTTAAKGAASLMGVSVSVVFAAAVFALAY